MEQPSPFFIGEVRVYPALNVIERDGTEAYVEPRVMDILLCLAARPGEVCTRQELLEAGWPGGSGSDEGLTKAICLLRQAAGDVAGAPTVIQTVPKRGYRLIAPIRLAPVASGGEGRPLPAMPRDMAQRSFPQRAPLLATIFRAPDRWRRVSLAGMVVLVVLAFVTGIYTSSAREGADASSAVRYQLLHAPEKVPSDAPLHTLDTRKPKVIKRRIRLMHMPQETVLSLPEKPTHKMRSDAARAGKASADSLSGSG